MLRGFLQATPTGNLEDITQILAEDSILGTDGGGKTAAALRPVHGAENVARFILSSQRFTPSGEQSLEFPNINGKTCAVFRVEGQVVIVIDVEIRDEKIQTIHVVGNPEKLRHLSA